MGLKTERNGTKIRTTNGGSSELIGANMYVTTATDPTTPMFEIIDSKASFAAVKELCDATCYVMQVRETRGAQTMLFNRSENPNVFRYALYAGYAGTATESERPRHDDPGPAVRANPRTAQTAAVELYDFRGVKVPAWSAGNANRAARLLLCVARNAKKPIAGKVVGF
jgi:hypothetical protein